MWKWDFLKWSAKSWNVRRSTPVLSVKMSNELQKVSVKPEFLDCANMQPAVLIDCVALVTLGSVRPSICQFVRALLFNYQRKMFMCRIIVRMRSIGFYLSRNLLCRTSWTKGSTKESATFIFIILRTSLLTVSAFYHVYKRLRHAKRSLMASVAIIPNARGVAPIRK